MPIDKFGRSQLIVGGVKAKLLQGPTGIGFKLTGDKQNFDLENKKLCNVADPSDSQDVVTLVYFEERINKLKLDLKEKINSLRAVTKLLEAVDVEKNYISFKGKKRLVSVNPSINTQDVIIRKELDAAVSALNTKLSKIDNSLSSLQTELNSSREQTNAALKLLTESLLSVTNRLSEQQT